MRRISILAMSLLLVFSLITPQVAHASDIKNHWAQSEMQLLVDKRIMGGYGNDTYLPNKNITRAEFTKLLLKSLDITATDSTSPFKDVKKGSNGPWYYADVVTAHREGLINGYTDKTFRPNNVISRQEMAAMIMTALEKKGISSRESAEKFVDEKSIAAYALPSVKRLHFLGIINGKTKTKEGRYYFKPKDSATRAETAVMLVRMLNIFENPKIITKYTSYNYDFKTMVEKQMSGSSRPQTDSHGSWYDASRGMVEYYANPNNFKDSDSGIYQFLLLSRSAGISEKDINEKILFDKGILKGRAASFIKANKEYNVNEVYLMAHALLETGNGTSDLANGIEVGLNEEGKPVMVTTKNKDSLKDIKKTYNMYGVGAYDHCPSTCGSERAYSEGWFTPEAAIVGGAKFISNGYITKGQDTLYKMRWNPASPGFPQYATDVGWAAKQTKRIQTMFTLIENVKGNALVFEIPKFINLPASSKEPQGVARFHIDTKLAGEKAIVKVEEGITLNVRSGPTTGFTAIGKLDNGTEITIVGYNSGWYKIKAGTLEGWVSGVYIQLVKDMKVATFSMETADNLNVTEQSEFDPVTGQQIVEVVADGTSLQAAPLFTDNVLMELVASTKVTIIEQTDDWYKVTVDGKEGWIFKDYLGID